MEFSKLISIIVCISLFQLALIAFFNPNKVNLIANKCFSLFFLSIACVFLNTSFYQSITEEKYYLLITFNELFRFFMAPALYLAISYFTSPNKVFKQKEYLHFMPSAFLFICVTSFTIANGNHFFSYLNIFPVSVRQLMPLFIAVLIVIQMLFYLILSLIILYRHQRNIKLINADVSSINLNWLQHTFYAILCMILLYYADVFFNFGWIRIYGSTVYLIVVLYVGYSLIAQREIYPFDSIDLKDINEVIIVSNSETINQRLTDKMTTQYKQGLISLMQTEKVYLDSMLNLPQLSKRMGISTHDLSYVLNKGFGMTFFTFVNSYRVEEAKTLMLSENHRQFNILGIAYKSGFNSKSTFNAAFKKETGLSPSQFISKAKSYIPQLSPIK